MMMNETDMVSLIKTGIDLSLGDDTLGFEQSTTVTDRMSDKIKRAAEHYYKMLQPFFDTDITAVIAIMSIVAKVTNNKGRMHMVREMLRKHEDLANLVVKNLSYVKGSKEPKVKLSTLDSNRLSHLAGYPLNEPVTVEA
jgi:hypothetical protein